MYASSDPISLAIIGCLGILTTLVALKLSRKGSREPGLPPGPPTLPLLGNIHQFPAAGVHSKFQEWSREYGGIFSVKIASGTMVIVSNAHSVKHLIDKTGWSASSRPENYLAGICTDNNHAGLEQHGPRLRKLKKAYINALSPQSANKYLPIQLAESTQLLQDMVHDPDNAFYHIRRLSHSVAKSVIYGKRIPQYASPEATEFFEILHELEHAVTPGTHPPIDLLPFLKWVPDRWAPWMKECYRIRDRRNKVHFTLLEECERRVARGDDANSFIEGILERQKEYDLERADISHLGMNILEAGSDTTAAFLQSLVLLFAAHPEVVTRAQKELDAAVGDSRLPILSDLEQCPYITAIVKEVNRYRPMLPIGIAHAMTQDEHYDGYLVPKDAMIFFNIWALGQDPDVYDRPELFNPDRYILSEYGVKPGVDDSEFRDTFVFGSGRRLCPGIHIARHTTNLVTMRLLWAFNYSATTDKSTGKEIPVDINNYSSDITLAPRPYIVGIKPRSQQHIHIIDSAFAESTDVFLRFEESISDEDREYLKSSRAKHY